MATDTVLPATPTPPATASAPDPTWGIAWGGGMLIVLTLWLRAKFEELYAPNHPLRQGLFALDSIEEIRIIEGKA